jgi:hypothetical protein
MKMRCDGDRGAHYQEGLCNQIACSQGQEQDARGVLGDRHKRYTVTKLSKAKYKNKKLNVITTKEETIAQLIADGGRGGQG